MIPAVEGFPDQLRGEGFRRCTICQRVLDDPADPSSQDCGGDCVSCMAKFGDPDCLEAMAILSGKVNTGSSK